MSLVPTPSQPQAIAANQTSPRPPSSRKQGIKQSPDSKVHTVLRSVNSSMERSAPEYTQSGLPSPYPSNFGDTQSEASSADHAPAAAAAAAPAPYSAQQESRPNYSTSATPTSEYGVFPQSARSGSFPEHIQRPYHPASSHAGGAGGMAQTPTSPSSVPVPVPDGRSHQNPPQGPKSDSDVPIDPSIAAPSPTYATHSQYSPYAAPPQDMAHQYPHPSSAGLYQQPRPDWSGYGQQHPGHMPPGHHPFPPNAASGPPQSRPSQVGKPPCARWCGALPIRVAKSARWDVIDGCSQSSASPRRVTSSVSLTLLCFAGLLVRSYSRRTAAQETAPSL
jgi:hypothetical protein